MSSGSTRSDDPETFDWAWTGEEEDQGEAWVPPPIDAGKPSVARMYDFLLGGKDNLAIDRTAAGHLQAAVPDAKHQVLANRLFMARAARFLAATGIEQFIDLGSGLPTVPSVHRMTQAIRPQARVVYVDNDPIVMAHNRAKLRDPQVLTLACDMRHPHEVLDHPQVNRLIDWDRPVAVIAVAVLHFVRVDIAQRMMERYLRDLAPGSALAVSAACQDNMPPADVARVEQVYSSATAPFVFRSRAQIEALFEGTELVDPGLTDLSQWRPDENTPTTATYGLAGVGIKPA